MFRAEDASLRLSPFWTAFKAGVVSENAIQVIDAYSPIIHTWVKDMRRTHHATGMFALVIMKACHVSASTLRFQNTKRARRTSLLGLSPTNNHGLSKQGCINPHNHVEQLTLHLPQNH